MRGGENIATSQNKEKFEDYEGFVEKFKPKLTTDECDEYAEHDEGLGLGNFKPEEIPVPHPQCLCVQYAVIPQSLEDIGAQIGRWASGEPDAVLDEWYARYGDRNPNGDPREILREGLKYEKNKKTAHARIISIQA